VKKAETVISQKFYSDDALIDRCIVTLAGSRGLMLVGEPGTAKSMLSELLTAAISGTSTNTIQGTAGTTEDAIKYSWNFALLFFSRRRVKTSVSAFPALHRFERRQNCPF
jgi:MoxR-like ATPase